MEQLSLDIEGINSIILTDRQTDRRRHYWIYDTKEKRTATRTGWSIRCNAESVCQAMNIKHEGVKEADKPERERRFVIKEA